LESCLGGAVTALWQAFEQHLKAHAPKDIEKADVRRYRQRFYDIFRDNFQLMAFFQSGSLQHSVAVTP
jgi:hypothetical protein